MPPVLLQSARLVRQLIKLSLTCDAASAVPGGLFWDGKYIDNRDPPLDGLLELLPLATSLRCLEVGCYVVAALKLVECIASSPNCYSTIFRKVTSPCCLRLS